MYDDDLTHPVCAKSLAIPLFTVHKEGMSFFTIFAKQRGATSDLACSW